MNYGGPPQYVTPLQPPPQQEPEHHVCVSGVPWCSGLAPCTECFHLLRDVVIPRVIVQAGLNGIAALMLFDLVAAMRARGLDPLSHFGVPVDLTRLDPTEQIRAALAAFEPAFRFLHEKIATDPALQARIKLTRVREDEPELGPEHGPGYGAPGYGEVGYPPVAAYPSGGYPPGVPVPGYPPGYAPQQVPPGYGAVPSPPSTEAGPGARTLDPFDTLGIGVQEPFGNAAPASPNGAVLGSIFGTSGQPVRPSADPTIGPADQRTIGSVPLEKLAPREPPRPLEADDIAISALPLDDEAATTSGADRVRNGAGS